jgi:hypothetical protein
MDAHTLGELEVVAADDDGDRAVELAAIDLFDRKLVAAIERRIVAYPEIVLDLIGGVEVLPQDVEGLAFVDDRYIVAPHLTHGRDAGWGMARDGIPGERDVSMVLFEFQERATGTPLSLSLDDIDFRSGSTIRRVLLRQYGGSVRLALLGIIAAAMFDPSEGVPGMARDMVEERYRVHLALQVVRELVEGSPCKLKLHYKPDVPALGRALNETYDVFAKTDPHTHQLRVCNLQVALTVTGYRAVGDIDGQFGPRTRAAWEAFRDKHDLSGPVDQKDYIELAELFLKRVEQQIEPRLPFRSRD